MFVSLKRQEFRDYFQLTKITIGVLKSSNSTGFNLITLCFSMYCSYDPNMVCFSIQNTNFSYKLLDGLQDCVLAIPGENLAEQTLFCGVKSGRSIDKVRECGINLEQSLYIPTPGIKEAKANIEIQVVNQVLTGDHITVFGEVKSFNVNVDNNERNLLSVGRDHEGFEVLVQKGIHRIAVRK